MAKPYNNHNASGKADECAPCGDSIPMSLASSAFQSARNQSARNQSARNITAVLCGT
jgi:hypothetical protein